MNPPKDYVEQPVKSDLPPVWFAWGVLFVIFLINAMIFYFLG